MTLIRKIINKDPKFKISDVVRISKYKNIFAKGYVPNLSEDVFVIRKVKNTVSWTYVINDINGEEIVETFNRKEFRKKKQKEFKIEKVIKRKGGKLYVKLKEYNNSFKSCIDKKNIVNKMNEWINLYK